MGTENYIVDDRCIVPPEIESMSAAELADKIAKYEPDPMPLTHNKAKIELPIHIEQGANCVNKKEYDGSV